ncbi:MAG TPA: bifunctional phosphopantothenoylcysteine decarboxylase/phosphopantothenate--cysteine ligase CoaBC [Alphaproteobacteria bacterium]|nr:bifunctional phosphopantothenoylcysteine decarboxylase/phosphopantothenate--cysteine ligase CoaBC [Alphaproteobacteria bacterium]
MKVMMKTSHSLIGRRVLLIISGGIAAYKSLDLIRRLRDQGADVRCILTAGGAQFITPLAVGALSENKVYSDLFSLTDEQEMGHIRLARDCDLVLVAPATANIMARMAHGLADDLASTVLLATDKPIMIAPAMNPVMWANVATQDNLALLKKRGVYIMPPASGDMACGESGAGRLPDVMEIVEAVTLFFDQTAPLRGLKALVTSGPTHEPLDPVRFLGNLSSGKQGHAIAAALAQAGADVTLISGPVQEAPPAQVQLHRVTTAEEMLAATLKSLPVDIAVCAAAVADYRPLEAASGKIKKSGHDGMTLQLVQNPDILHTLSHSNQRPQLVIGFAAETDAAIDKAKEKLSRKGCDWLLLNDVGNGKVFGEDRNTITLLKRDAKGDISSDAWPAMDKQDVARRLVSQVANQIIAAG